MNHLSQTSKLNAKSWSLAAWETCPGARDKNGTAVPACAGCYARTGFYVFPVVKQAREANREAWRDANWVGDMVKALKKEVLFRWFDSGDIYHPALANKIKQVIEQTPWVRHWLPTRSYKIAKFRHILEQIATLPNVAVRYSADSIDGNYTPGLHGSVIVPTANEAPAEAYLCGAYSRGGKCGPCDACYRKDVAVIAYPAHGRVINKLIQIARANQAG